MKKQRKDKKVQTILKVNSILGCLSSLGLLSLLLALVLFFICEVVNSTPLTNYLGSVSERWVVGSEIIAGVVMILCSFFAIFSEKMFVARHSFESFIKQIKKISVLNYFEYIPFLRILGDYLAEDTTECAGLKRKIYKTYSLDKVGTVKRIAQEYYNGLDANRILECIKQLTNENGEFIADLAEEKVDACFKLEIVFRGFVDIYNKLYTDKIKRVIELCFLISLILAFLGENKIDITGILNSLAIFLLAWDLFGGIKNS